MTPFDPARWAKVRDLVEGALERPPADRAAWLDANTAGDPELRAEVERLLAADERSGARLDTPLDLATLMDEESETSVSLGTGARVGTYAVEDELGEELP